MKLREVLDFVEKIKPGNPYDTETKIQWLNELEGDIQSHLLNTAPQEIIQYTTEDMETTLLIPAPFDRVYWPWVAAMIDFANGEYSKYQNTLRLVNDAYDKYAKWFHRKFHEDTGGFLFIGGTTKYGLSAYEIAVNHGYEGTEEEWLEHLIGPVGPQGLVGEGLNIVDMLESEADLPDVEGLKAGTGYLVGEDADALLFIWNGEEWIFKQSLRGKQGNGIESVTSNTDGTWSIRYTNGTSETLSNEAYLTLLQTMQTATKDASEAAGSASAAAKNANDAADNANKAAGGAVTAANNANAAEGSANDAAGKANTAANSATDAANSANTAANDANTAAGKATAATVSTNLATSAANTAAEKASEAASAAYNAAGGAKIAMDAAYSAASAANTAADNASDAASVANTAAQNAQTAADEIQTARANGDFDGADGVSPTLIVSNIENGHRITITDKDGEKEIDLKNGKDGYTPVKGVDYNDGYTPVKGKDYNDGAPGHTPVKGTDYWTEADIAEIKSYVDEAILGGAW